MKNIYIEKMPYNEIAITLEDFMYDNKVKCAIPSICINKPILNLKNQIKKINNDNIMNISKSNQNKEIIITNYIELFIPHTYSLGCSEGKAGTKFIVTFVGGNKNNYNICGRYYK